MDKTTFRILEVLGNSLGSQISINELKNRISEKHPAYYKNIYDKVVSMEKGGIIILETIGRSRAVSLNFEDYRTIGLLGEMERIKLNSLMENTRLRQLLEGLDKANPTCIINPIENLKLNRAELLTLEIYKEAEYHSRKAAIKTDQLILSEKAFLGLLKSYDFNPLKTMLKNFTVIIKPDDFWDIMKEALKSRVTINKEYELPLSQKDLAYNMGRFGYIEIGERIKESDNICLEMVISSILISGSQREKEAIGALLHKNKTNYPLLIFLCKKYNKLEQLLGILNVLNKIAPTKELTFAIKTLDELGVKEEKADYMSIKKKVELYD